MRKNGDVIRHILNDDDDGSSVVHSNGSIDKANIDVGQQRQLRPQNLKQFNK